MSRCYSQLTLPDRRRLHHLMAAKVPINEMARQLGRHRSTIYREITRNTFRDRELPDYNGYYTHASIVDAVFLDGAPYKPPVRLLRRFIFCPIAPKGGECRHLTL